MGLTYSTYLGGSDRDALVGLAEGAGPLVMTGWTFSQDLGEGGAAAKKDSASYAIDAFVVRLSPPPPKAKPRSR